MSKLNKKIQKKSNSKILRELSPNLDIGIQLALSVIIFTFIGRWLDSKYGTEPWWMLSLAIFGVVVGMWNFFRTVLKLAQKEKIKKEEK